MFSKVSHNLEQTRDIARELARTLPDHTVVLVQAPMGAGKTTFIYDFVQARLPGLSQPAHSPTFTIENYYSGADGRRHVIHYDLYRLKSWDQWLALALLEKNHLELSVVFIEWSDTFDDVLWKNYFTGSGFSVKTLVIDVSEKSRRFLIT